jgi:nondiscriminating aspartyl-tRNA synthetase
VSGGVIVVRIWSDQIGEFAGQTVSLAGWLHRVRQLSSVCFLVLRDGAGLAQVVIENPAVAAAVSQLTPESVIAVQGLVVAQSQAPSGFEIHHPEVVLMAPAVAPPPFEMHRPTLNAQLPMLLDHAPVALRHPRQRALFQLSAATMAGFRRALTSQRFVEIQTPKIVASATEGGANVFKIDYFGRPAYLAQSPQFYKQTMVGVFERVFEVGPVFRAEPHDTPRHLSEYVSLDLEMGFIRDHTDVMQTLRGVLAGRMEAVRDEAAAALEILKVSLPVVPEQIPALHFAEAQELILRETGEDARSEPDLAPAHERWLGEWALRETGSEFLFVTGYPMVKRPFYTHPDPDRPTYSNSFDVLFRGLELVTGGQRLHLYADYLAALQERGLDPAPYETYLQAFRHGMPPHGGCAIGLERWVARLVGAQNIRETTLFPRDLNRVTP